MEESEETSSGGKKPRLLGAASLMKTLVGHDTGSEILDALDEKSSALLVYLIEAEVAFLLSDIEDPDRL